MSPPARLIDAAEEALRFLRNPRFGWQASLERLEIVRRLQAALKEARDEEILFADAARDIPEEEFPW